MLIVAGPTASGKSDLAARLALATGGEIVGADAFQIYRGMPILTAQPDAATLAATPHHLVGSIDPAEAFHVARYLALARAAIAGIRARGRLPIVVGGTGLYLRALTRGLSPLPAANPDLRARLELLSKDALLERLAELDPDSAQTIDPHNRRRLVRALEVCLLSGKPVSSLRTAWRHPPAPHAFHAFFLEPERPLLHARIAARTREMFRRGLLDEVRALPALGPTASRAIGLVEARACLAGTLSRDAAIEAITIATRQYAKRQLTWLRREVSFTKITVSSQTLAESLFELTLPLARACLDPGQRPPNAIPHG